MPLSNVIAIQVNGTEYDTVPTNVKGSGAGGNGGAGTKLGSGNSVLDNVAVSRADTNGVFGSTVLDNDHADKALDAGVFAYNNEKPIAKRLTTSLATVSDDVLLSGATVPSLVRSIHKLETLRTTRTTSAIRANKFNRYTGQWESGYPVTATDSLNTDEAAVPTRNVPGSLTFTSSGANIQTSSYTEKTG